jgi:hypothetical protein
MLKRDLVHQTAHGDAEVLVQWVLRRGNEQVTCQVDVRRNGKTTYEVAVVPHHAIETSTVEATPSSVAALQRHAELALWLREQGWSVARRTSVNS